MPVQPANVRKTGEWQESRVAAKTLPAPKPNGSKENPIEVSDDALSSSSSSSVILRRHAVIKKRKELARLELEELELEEKLEDGSRSSRKSAVRTAALPEPRSISDMRNENVARLRESTTWLAPVSELSELPALVGHAVQLVPLQSVSPETA